MGINYLNENIQDNPTHKKGGRKQFEETAKMVIYKCDTIDWRIVGE